jgi:hypothetical protein
MIHKPETQIVDFAQFVQVLSVKRSAACRATGPAKARELERKTALKWAFTMDRMSYRAANLSP